MVMSTANRNIIIKIHQILHICMRNEIRLIVSQKRNFFYIHGNDALYNFIFASKQVKSLCGISNTNSLSVYSSFVLLKNACDFHSV